MAQEIKVKFNSVKRSGDQVTIDSPKLVQALVEINQQALKGLSQHLAPITADDIQLDGQGRVVIRNAKFVEALEKFPGGPDQFMTNYNCNGMSNTYCS